MSTTKERVNKALTLVVPTANTKDYDKEDLDNLMQTYAVMEQAKDSFLNGEITFEEYISLAEKAEINVDSYMETIEHNLIQLNLF